MATTDPLVFRTIDGAHYQCRKLPSMRALQLTTELARHLGTPLLTILAGASDEKIDPWALAQYVMREGLDNLHPAAVQNLMLRTLEAVTVSNFEGHLGDEQRFNSHFDARPGGIMTAIEVWLWALSHNFRSFFDVARSRLSPPEPANSANEGSATAMDPAKSEA